MNLGQPTLCKFIRESLVTTTPLILDENGIADLKNQLQAWFAHNDDMTLQWHDGQGGGWYGLVRSLCHISLKHPKYGSSYGGFGIGLGAQKKLSLNCAYNGEVVPIGKIEELCAFLRLVHERVQRRKGQHAKQNKVRKLRGAAILARVRQLARKYQFDFATSENNVSLGVTLRFDNSDIVEFVIPFAKFDEMLPQIEAAVPQLRELVRAGITSWMRPRFANQTRRNTWVLHQSLGTDEAENALEE